MILNPLISQLCFCKKPHILLYWYSIQPIVPNWRKQQQTNGRPKNTDVPMGMTDLKRVVLLKGISRFFQEVFWLVGIFTPKIGGRWSHFDDHNFSKGVGSTTKYIVFWFVSSLMEIHPEQIFSLTGPGISACVSMFDPHGGGCALGASVDQFPDPWN